MVGLIRLLVGLGVVGLALGKIEHGKNAYSFKIGEKVSAYYFAVRYIIIVVLQIANHLLSVNHNITVAA